MNKKEEIGTDIRVDVGKNYKGKLELSGNSKQETREGYNMFDVETISPNKYIHEGELRESTVSNTSDYIEVKANNNYLLTFDFSVLANTNSRGWCLFDNNKQHIESNTFDLSTKKITLTPSTDGYIRFSYDINCKNIQFIKGTDEKDYEPYGAMPSLKFPSEIKSCGDGGSINEVVCNKNLWKFECTKITPFSQTWFFFDGKAGAWGTNIQNKTEYYIKLKAGIYNFSYKNAYNCVFHIIDNNEKILIYDYFPKTIELKEDTYIIPRFRNIENNVETYVEGLQIEKVESLSDTATDYVQHEEQTISIPVQQPMLEGDYFDWDNEEEVHSWGKIELTGDETLKTLSYGRFQLNLKNNGYAVCKDKYYEINAICTHFKCASQSELASLENTVSANGDNVYIKITNETTLEELIAILQEQYSNGTPLIIYYKLAEPIRLPFTEEQNIALDKLENIILYEGINHIYCLDEVSPLLRLTYYKIIEDYDMYISSNGRFVVPKYNIDYLVDMASSTLFGMPEAAENSARIAGRDGDMVLSTTYQPLNGNIVCYTEDNLTPQEKSDEERKINRFLNEIKNTFKKIAIENNNIFYEIKYNGLLTTTNFPKHIQFSIPLKSSKSYGFGIVKKEITGNGTLESDTIKECGAIFTIRGPALNPIISLNDYSMEFESTILEGAKLIIDSNKSTVTYINPNGVKTNQMKYYNHQFPKIQNGKNELKVLSGINDDTQVKVEWYDLML